MSSYDNLHECKLTVDSLKEIQKKIDSTNGSKESLKEHFVEKKELCEEKEKSLKEDISKPTPHDLHECKKFIENLKDTLHTIKNLESQKKSIKSQLRTKRHHCINLEKLTDLYINDDPIIDDIDIHKPN